VSTVAPVTIAYPLVVVSIEPSALSESEKRAMSVRRS
jgi:hypothetical protein